MEKQADLAGVEQAIRGHDVAGVALVSPQDVVTARWVRMKCQYGCGGYGMSLTCPPHSPTPEQTRRMLDEYSRAYLIHWGAGGADRKALAQMEREAFLSGFYKAFALACGPCRACDPCPLEPPCRHPHLARPAMEACGIDVYETARRAGLPIEVVTCREDVANYYSLLLLE